ncbi:hypothetical protein GQR58_030218 [Nymphon striatum]|nr:hypothetical protein GQR58_030218 [Nymphon striatum]
MPWWLLGLSMVATTFSTDTPNLVTDLVRTTGVSGNWGWWCMLLTGMLTVFIYAKLWRKSNVSTDLEFYEMRYGVNLAAIKIGGIMLGLEPWQTIVGAGLITVVFSALGGFKGVVYTDFLLFFVAMAGAIGAAYYLVNIPELPLASLVVYPDIASIATAFPNVPADKLGHDLAYSAMLTKLPSGLLALAMQNAEQIFKLLILFGAGTGLIFILRWFWWRINAWTEISAMFASGILSYLLKTTALGPLLFAADTGIFPTWGEIPFVMIVTTAIWLIATFVTKPESNEVLRSFYKRIQPGGPGWAKVVKDADTDNVTIDTGEKWSCIAVALLIGYWLLMTVVPVDGVASTLERAPNNLANWLDVKVFGLILTSKQDKKATILMGVGGAMLIVGHAWDIFFPINKALWTSSFVLVTAGLGKSNFGFDLLFNRCKEDQIWKHI